MNATMSAASSSRRSAWLGSALRPNVTVSFQRSAPTVTPTSSASGMIG
jgi:hypothetical protein